MSFIGVFTYSFTLQTDIEHLLHIRPVQEAQGGGQYKDELDSSLLWGTNQGMGAMEGGE